MRTILVIGGDCSVEPVGPIAEGELGTDQTVAAIWGVLKAATPGTLIAWREAADRFGPERPRKVGEILARVYAFLAHRGTFQFKRDPEGIELIRTPAAMLRARNLWGEFPTSPGVVYGDCDDRATLGAAILREYGLSPVFVVVGYGLGTGRSYAHILFGVVLSQGELTLAEAELGRMDSIDVGGGRVVVCMDPQEGRPVGHVPPEPMRRIYFADGKHVKSGGVA